MIRPLLILCVLALGACTSPPDPRLLLPGAQPMTGGVTVARSVEIREISLPYYAEGEEVAILGENGTVEILDSLLWADLPPRALTLRLAETLARALPQTAVAAEPWPLLSRAELSVNVQVSRILGAPGGVLDFEGQYFIVAEDRGSYERARAFDLSLPVTGVGAGGIASAQARAIEELATLIATDLAGVTTRDLGRR